MEVAERGHLTPPAEEGPASGSEGESDPEGSGKGGRECGLLAQMLRGRKSLESIVEEALHDQGSGGAKLTLLDLLCVGIGSTIGSGVFVLTGKALPQAGPAAVISWMLAGLICLLSSSSYMELSARLPTKGSCYVFSYHALGELAGVFGSVCLAMEYGISGAGVARGWSAKLAKVMGTPWVWCYSGEGWGAGCNEDDDYYLDPLAALITALSTAVVMKGLDMGKVVINLFTLAKVCLVSFLVVAGLSLWRGNMFASAETFAPRGAGGVLQATSKLFFGFIGFDEVCCMASKAENPSKTVPRALAGTLLGAALFSGLSQLALSAMVPYTPDMGNTSFEQSFHEQGISWARWLVAIGELVLLPLVVLLSILPTPEVSAAMSEDGLLPAVFGRQNKAGVYFQGTALIGVALTAVAFAVPFAVLWDIISLGVLLSFNLTNGALINVRYGNGGKVLEPWVDALVQMLLLSTATAGIALQQGLAQPLLSGGKPHTALSAIGTVGVVAAVGVMLTIYFGFPTRCDMDHGKTFLAWGVPFVPGLAMFCNFFLIATLPPEDFLYFSGFMLSIFALYFGYKLQSWRELGKGPPSSDAEELSQESN